jgi:hypothetical protein
MEIISHITSAYHFKSTRLYNSQEYIHQLNDPIKSFYQVDNDLKKVLLAIRFQIIDGKAISLENAPFGGFEISEKLDHGAMNKFITHIINDFEEQNIKEIIIKIAPSLYYKNCPVDFTQLLISHEFDSIADEINHHIEISKDPLSDLMHSMEKRKYNKCVNSNFVFQQESLSNFNAIFQFIYDCRIEKDQSLSMQQNDLKKMIVPLSESYLLFSVRDGNKLIAASICIVVNNRVIYNFYPASSLAYNNYSPMVLLAASIYQYGQKNGYEILDLGTSMLNNKPNESLIRFKENIGGIRTQRQILKLSL